VVPGGSEALFWNRYTVAEGIGAAADFQGAVRRTVSAVKYDAGSESPLVLIGHSMGALMMYSAFATLLQQDAMIQSAGRVRCALVLSVPDALRSSRRSSAASDAAEVRGRGRLHPLRAGGSLSADRRRKAKTKAGRGQGDKGDR
jgi:alpha-beta hydrolase superfamily lysophospholipase